MTFFFANFQFFKSIKLLCSFILKQVVRILRMLVAKDSYYLLYLIRTFNFLFAINKKLLSYVYSQRSMRNKYQCRTNVPFKLTIILSNRQMKTFIHLFPSSSEKVVNLQFCRIAEVQTMSSLSIYIAKFSKQKIQESLKIN